MRKRTTFLFLVIAVVLSLYTRAAPQVNNSLQIENDALDKVPSANRARLTERLELYIESEIKRDMGGIYDLKAEDCKNGLRRDEWLKEARFKEVGQFQKFIFKDAYKGDGDGTEILPGEKWIIAGCGVYKVKNESVGYKLYYDLLLMNNEWYFCHSGIAVEGENDEYVRCTE